MKTPEEWFNDDVWPNYGEYKADPLNERKARNAAISARHFPERVFHYYEAYDRSRLHETKSPAALLDYLAKKHRCPELEILKEVADASKHHFPFEKNVGSRLVTTATDAVWKYGDKLYIRGWNRDFDEVLEKVVAFWRSWLGLP